VTKRLILNADDFGLTKGVDDGIIRAHRDGILTSATLMANGEAFDHAVALALANPELGVGCHLVLVGGKCVAPPEDIRSLADAEGHLPGSLVEFVTRVSTYTIRSAHLEIELRAQIEKIKRAGIAPTHVDTHKHTHTHPRVLPMEKLRDTWSRLAPSRQRLAASAARATGRKFVALCKKYGLHYPDNFLGLASTGALSGAALCALIDTLPDGQSEIMLHPGICDADLAQTGSRLQQERELEMQALLDPKVRDTVAARGIRLITYGELA